MMGSMHKVKKKSFPKSINEMSKEMLQETLKKKKECNAKALQTVEKMCEENVNLEWFLENLQFINQCHFDDATVERAISKICGYPLCDAKLDKIPTQQYRISTRYNKVFDIRERKNFCSNDCYKSAMHIKNQLFTSPLWFRDQEVIPKYTLLKSKSSMGEEVVFFPDKINQDKNVSKKNDLDLKIDDLADKCSNLAVDDSGKNFSEIKITKNINNSDNKNNENRDNIVKEPENVSDSVIKCKIVNAVPNQNVFCENLRDIISGETKVENKTTEKPVNTVSKVEKCIFEWFSIDTLFFLYSDKKLKEMFQDEAVKMKDLLNSKLSMERQKENIDRMIRLYGLLDSSVFNRNESKTNLKPLPDYSVLREEGKKLEVKVKAFYQGQLELQPPVKEDSKLEETNTDSDTIYLPLIDAHAQSSLRRKIILDKLNRVLPELIHALDTDYVLQMNEVRNLVSTFKLTAHNITFKPKEWYLVGVILIKLLCIKDKGLEKILTLESSKCQLSLILSSYEIQDDYLNNLILSLTDGTKLIEKLTDK